MFNKEHIIETNLSREEVVAALNTKISHNVKLQFSNEYWFRGEIRDNKFILVFEPNQGYQLTGSIDLIENGKTEIHITFHGGDIFAIVWSILVIVALSALYLRFHTILCFLGAIMGGGFFFFAFTSKKEKCLSYIREIVNGIIVR